jgi:hypothetical protein
MSSDEEDINYSFDDDQEDSHVDSRCDDVAWRPTSDARNDVSASDARDQSWKV